MDNIFNIILLIFSVCVIISGLIYWKKNKNIKSIIEENGMIINKKIDYLNIYSIVVDTVNRKIAIIGDGVNIYNFSEIIKCEIWEDNVILDNKEERNDNYNVQEYCYDLKIKIKMKNHDRILQLLNSKIEKHDYNYKVAIKFALEIYNVIVKISTLTEM